MSEQTKQDLERRYFGRGIRLTSTEPDGIGVDVAFEDGDLALVSGGDNLGQDLKVALLTGAGTDVFNVGFGFDGLRVLSSDMTPQMTTEMMRLAVMKTVATDARVRRVLDVSMKETEPGSRKWMVRAEVQTVLGEVLELTIGDVSTR